MSNQDEQRGNMDWLDEFEELANAELTEGSACAQIHPIIEAWLDELLENDPPDSRDSVWQAMSCLSTEILDKLTPESILDELEDTVDEDEVATWVQSILLVGRAFQTALDSGRLDDL
jgi:hypothetical protein